MMPSVLLAGKAGANMGAFVAKHRRDARADPGAEFARHHRAGAGPQRPDQHYKAEREGADRVENLEELVNAAESFVTQEGFGRDAVALPVDELDKAP
jgi:DNA helicase-2/ATP-dependent DNA helicase PcrA